MNHAEHPQPSTPPGAARGPRPRRGGRIPTLAEADAYQEALYARRAQVYPREVHGTFARWRVALAGLTLGVFYLLPWADWQGRQAFLIDLPARKFYLFAWTFWPQDLFYLTALLIISALSLFLFTAIAGRLWCGYACPQTVWTEVFLWIERKFEGDRARRMKLDARPWNGEKALRKGGKHLVWVLFSLWTGFTFVGFFTPIRDLGYSALALSLGPWETFWILFYGFATYGNAGWMREQVCTYMCPYARFQGVMFDRETLVISYDGARGEPRGSRQRGLDYRAAGLGDCIDCTLCVQVCPTGIDIRNGLQIECIACAACIDVCDTVMDKMGYPRGLIRYTTENALEGRPSRLLRPRVAIYALVLLALVAGLVTAVMTRVPLEVDVIRDRNTLYREVGSDQIENVYVVKVLNMDERSHAYRITAEGIPDLTLESDVPSIVVPAGQVNEVPVRLRTEEENLTERSTRVVFQVQATDNPRLKAREETRFLGPMPEGH